jgi:nucleotide-binding universal stress UspA family protein
MSTYRRILAAVDGSEAGKAGLGEALRLAKGESAQLFIVHVVNEAFPYTPLAGAPPMNFLEILQESGRRVLEHARAEALAAGVEVTTILLESDERSAAHGILEEAGKRGADLIVLGTHGRRGLRRLVLGSDAELVVRSAPVPVLLVRAPS